MIARLVVASSNAGKLREIGQILAPLGIELLPQATLGVTEAEEPHGTFIENALAKARHAARVSGLPALADDSGLCVSALRGEPGVHSARFAGEPKDDRRNNERLIALMAGQADRSAYYACVMVLLRHPDDPEPLIAHGRWHGTIVAEPRGDGGFGYDPHFFLPEHGCTAAELPAERKNGISHRAQALAALFEQLRARDSR